MNAARFVYELTKRSIFRIDDATIVLDVTPDCLVVRRDLTTESCKLNFARSLQTSRISPAFVTNPDGTRVSPTLVVLLNSAATAHEPMVRMTLDEETISRACCDDDTDRDAIVPSSTLTYALSASERDSSDPARETKVCMNRPMSFGTYVSYETYDLDETTADEEEEEEREIAVEPTGTDALTRVPTSEPRNVMATGPLASTVDDLTEARRQEENALALVVANEAMKSEHARDFEHEE